jgi:hypothetical protein
MAIVRLEGLRELKKNPITSSGIEPATSFSMNVHMAGTKTETKYIYIRVFEKQESQFETGR